MKILVLSFYFAPDLCAGSFRCTALVNELTKINNGECEIEIITTIPNRYSSFSTQALKHEVDGNLKIHRVPLPNHKSGMFDQAVSFVSYYRAVWQMTTNTKYDLVFATSSRLFTAFLGARISRKKKIPLYLDIRDIFVDTLRNVLNPKISFAVTPFLSLIEKYTFSRAAFVNLVSEGFKGYFQQRYPHLKYSYFTNGIDDEFLEQDGKEGPCAGVQKTILYAGNIGEGQGLHKIIPEFAKLVGSQFAFKIIGDGGRKRELVKAVEDLKLFNVEFLEPMDRATLIKHYKTADVLFLHLNDYEAFKKVLPSKIFEYGALNKPILAGVAGYSAEFIGENIENAEVFQPCNSGDAKKALGELSLRSSPRASFVEKYRRTTIMKEMANSIIIKATN